MLAAILKKIVLRMLTQKVAEEVIVLLLKEASKRTDNKVDDKLVEIVEDALGTK